MKFPALRLFPLVAALLVTQTGGAMAAPPAYDLHADEDFRNPLGFHDAKPQLSWKLPVGTVRQSASRIVMDDSDGTTIWDSGKVESDRSVWIGYGGEPLKSRQSVTWKVRFWDQDGRESDWSEPSHIEMGLLSNDDWKAQWIEAPAGGKVESAHPGYLFRKDFTVGKKVVKARLYASALGIYRYRINGKRVGEDILAPGWTSYGKRVETITYDVAPLLRDGDNAIGALLGEGWYAGSLFQRDLKTLGGRKPKLLGQLEIEYDDGSSETIATDGTWKASDRGPIVAAGYYFGEDYDARREMKDWSSPGFDDSAWKQAVATKPAAEPLLQPKPMPPVRVAQEVAAKSAKELRPGVFLFDFGQNLVGFPELRIPVRKDATIGIRVAEMLNKDGTPYIENYRAARARANYTAAADEDIVWEPALTFFGFRYLELSGFPEGVKLSEEAAVAKVIHTDFKSTGKFSSSSAKLNQLQSNIRWGQIGNFVDVPTDCPQRDERLGWTGDAQVFLPTSFFNYDVHSFWSRWLQTARDDQRPDGGIPFVIPADTIGMKGVSPGWADAIVTAPWEVYERTGDMRILEDNFAAMKKWVGFYERDAKGFITGIKGFGDWLQPYAENKRGDTPQEVIATAYFGRDARILGWAADALGKKDEAERYRKLHESIRKAFSGKFIAEGGAMPGDTQTGYLMALGYDLVEPALRESVESRLLASFEKADRHLRTGFLGTPLLAATLDKIGHPEISQELLFKETYPGWFYSINQGATTMWERWNSYSHKDGFGDAGMNSFNHYAYGAIGQWMYERVAGLAPDPARPGYKHFFIRPLVGGPLTSAAAEYETPYGLAKCAWKMKGESLTMDVTVPPNTSATVVFPKVEAARIQLDGKPLGQELKIDGDNNPAMEVSAGNYKFELPAP